MSTLISRLGRRFREKPKSKNLNLPALPTPREILEDIENCQNGDRVIGLATLIQKKGRQSSLLDKDFLEDPSISPNASSSSPHLAFLSPYQTTSSSVVPAGSGGGGSSGPSSLNEEDHSSSTGTAPHSHPHHKRKGSLTLVGGVGSASSSNKSKSKAISDAEHLDSYNKLKQFLLLFEKSEEILESLEPHFKRVENSLQQRHQLQQQQKQENEEDFSALPTTTTAALTSNKNIIKASLNDNGDILQVEAEDEDFNHRNRQLSDSSDVCSSPLL